jgi:hypothetical protein
MAPISTDFKSRETRVEGGESPRTIVVLGVRLWGSFFATIGLYVKTEVNS